MLVHCVDQCGSWRAQARRRKGIWPQISLQMPVLWRQHRASPPSKYLLHILARYKSRIKQCKCAIARFRATEARGLAVASSTVSKGTARGTAVEVRRSGSPGQGPLSGKPQQRWQIEQCLLKTITEMWSCVNRCKLFPESNCFGFEVTDLGSKLPLPTCSAMHGFARMD